MNILAQCHEESPLPWSGCRLFYENRGKGALVETEETPPKKYSYLLWGIVGIVLLLVYGILSYVKCRRLVKTAVRLEPVEVQTGGPHGHRRLRRGTNVWECDGIWSPFVLGIFHPRIYIPFHMEPQERTYILAHEQTHIRRCDHLIKLVAYLLLCVYLAGMTH